MRFLVFGSSIYLYLAASAGCLLSWMYYVHDAPWTIDSKSNTQLSGIPISEFLSSLRSEKSNSAPQLVQQLLLANYKFSALSLLLSSILLLLIVFFAAKNRTLTLMTHLSFGVWLIGFGVVMQPFSGESLHSKLYYTIVVANVIGTCMYVVHLVNIRNLIKKKQHEANHAKEEKKTQ